MRVAFGLFLIVAAAIAGAWWWLGLPVAMPPSPLDPGEKLYCVSYAPFRGLQSPIDPSIRIDAAQIEDDLRRLAKLTHCVRTYSTDFGLDQVAGIAARHGLKVIQGLWIGRDPARNRSEIETVIGLVKRHPDTIRSVVVGNEALLRGEIAPDALAAIVRRVKSQVAVPLTYADVWEFWLRAREVFDAVDFVTIHILPYWEDLPIPASQAAAHVEAIRRKVAEAYPGKEILLGEVGWPSAGRMREGALPSPANQAQVIHDILAVAKRESFNVNVIEAFDQPWKEFLEGTVGGHWGFLDGDTREFKFDWGQPVSNHPQWRLGAAQGIALAALVFVAAALERRRKLMPDRPVSGVWFAVAGIAITSGVLIGLAIENVPLESLGIGGWLRNIAMAALAVAAPIACAAALMRQVAVPPFWRVLGRADSRPADGLVLTLGIALVGLTVIAVVVALGLVFDPRYRDFPFAPLTAAAVPFLALTVIGPRRDGPRGMAETIAAVVLAASAIFVALNETFENWQALWLSAALLVLAVTLFRSRDARSPGS
jgi:exo-beta-1,3-glucanase (GH17 family)